MNNPILADGRWIGAHGIGRFAHEVLSHLQHCDIFSDGPPPLSLKNLYWLPQKLQKKYHVFFSPGFMPPIYSRIPFVFTLHDLIHIQGPGSTPVKKLFYNTVIKYATRQAATIVTVSEYSKNEIMAWAKIPAEKILVVKNGVSQAFIPEGKIHQPEYPYLLHVGNTTKPHKNIPRLIQAFANAKIDKEIKLILTGTFTAELTETIIKNHLQQRIVWSGPLSEKQLAEYYRGAIALVYPSLYEGFGLPVAEAMACGVPVITSNVTSLPEVAGDAAIMINPLDQDALSFQMEHIIVNDILRKNLVEKGLKQAGLFSWDVTVKKIQEVLNQYIK